MAKERWEKEAGKREVEEADDADDKARDEGTGEAEGYTQEETEKGGTQSQGEGATAAQHEDVGREDHGKRQRGAEELDEQGRWGGEPGGERQKNARQRDWPEKPRSVVQSKHEQRGIGLTRAEGEDTQGTQQREEQEQNDSNTGRKRKGKERMSTHQLDRTNGRATNICG